MAVTTKIFAMPDTEAGTFYRVTDTSRNYFLLRLMFVDARIGAEWVADVERAGIFSGGAAFDGIIAMFRKYHGVEVKAVA